MEQKPNINENKKILIEVTKEDTIESVAQKMVEAWAPGSYTSVVFEGTEITASGGDTPDDIVKKYEIAKAEKSS